MEELTIEEEVYYGNFGYAQECSLCGNPALSINMILMRKTMKIILNIMGNNFYVSDAKVNLNGR